MFEEAHQQPSRILETGEFIKRKSSCEFTFWKHKITVLVSAQPLVKGALCIQKKTSRGNSSERKQTNRAGHLLIFHVGDD